MRKYVFFLVFLFSSPIEQSCFKSNHAHYDFSEDSFCESINMKEGITLKIDSLIFGRPTLLRFHPDSFLIIQEMNTSKIIKIIDLKTNKIQQLIPQGKGPGEIIHGWGVENVGRDLYVFCGQLKKVIILTPNNRNFDIIDEFVLDEKQTTGFFPLKPDFLACMSNIGDSSRLTILDSRGIIKFKMGDYPPFLNSDKTMGDNYIFQSSISGCATLNKIVLACKNTDVLEIYDLNNGLEKRFQGPIGIQVTILDKQVGKWTMRLSEPGYLTYGDLNANDNEIWVTYLGYKKIKGDRPPQSNLIPNKIFCFDWHGNPIRKMEFLHPFRTFDVDWDGKVLYTLVWEEENPEIITYPLNDILK